MRHAAHHELRRRALNPSRFSRIKPNCRISAGVRAAQGRVELRHEQRIVGGQRGDEGRIDREVVARGMTGPAGAAVSLERLLEKELRALRDELVELHGSATRRRRRRFAHEQNRQEESARIEPSGKQGIGLRREIRHESRESRRWRRLFEQDRTGAFVDEAQTSEEYLLEDIHRSCPLCPAPNARPGATTTRSIVKPSGRFRPRTACQDGRRSHCEKSGQPEHRIGHGMSLSLRSTSHTL